MQENMPHRIYTQLTKKLDDFFIILEHIAMISGRKKDRKGVCMCTTTNITSNDNNPAASDQ